jgi:hypothetical protein
MCALLVAALALLLFFDMPEKPKLEFTPASYSYAAGLTIMAYTGAAPAASHGGAKQNCFRIFGVCW